MAAATRASTAAELTANGAKNAGIAANVRQAASTVAARVAMVAGAVATGVATAAQWAFNAAMSANPIALIIIAIAALVAGLIWFFTQTELGKEIFANVAAFIGQAMENIRLFIVGVIDWVVANWPLLLAILTGPIGLLVLFIVSNFEAIIGFFVGLWDGIVALFNTAVAVLLDLFFRFNPLGIIIANFGAIVQFFVDLWTNVSTAVSTGIANVITFFTELPGKAMAALGNLKDTALQSGKDLIQGFIDGIGSMIGKVGDVVGNVLGGVADFFPHSPAKKGPFSGAGWRAVGASGRAIFDEFQSGIPADALLVNGGFAANVVGSGSAGSGTVPGSTVGDTYNTTINAVDGQSAAEIEAIARYERQQSKRSV
jgi:hypothetical protein